MTFPEPGSGPTYEIDELWEDAPAFSAELELQLRSLADRASELYAWLNSGILA